MLANERNKTYVRENPPWAALSEAGLALGEHAKPLKWCRGVELPLGTSPEDVGHFIVEERIFVKDIRAESADGVWTYDLVCWHADHGEYHIVTRENDTIATRQPWEFRRRMKWSEPKLERLGLPMVSLVPTTSCPIKQSIGNWFAQYQTRGATCQELNRELDDEENV